MSLSLPPKVVEFLELPGFSNRGRVARLRETSRLAFRVAMRDEKGFDVDIAQTPCRSHPHLRGARMAGGCDGDLTLNAVLVHSAKETGKRARQSWLLWHSFDWPLVGDATIFHFIAVQFQIGAVRAGGGAHTNEDVSGA